MNVYLQIGIGLIPSIIVGFFIHKKERQRTKLRFLLLLLVASISFVCFGINKTYISKKVSKGDTIKFAYQLLLNEDYNDASKVMDDYVVDYGYDDNVRLFEARMSLIEGKYEKAAILYNYLESNSNLVKKNSDEVTTANLKNDYKDSEYAVVQYLSLSDSNYSDYGYTEEDLAKLDESSKITSLEISNIVKNAVQKKYSISSEGEVIANLVSISNDRDLTQEEKETLDEYKDSKYLSLNIVKEKVTSAYLKSQDYDIFLSNVNSNSSYKDIMVVIDMYMNKDISDDEIDSYVDNKINGNKICVALDKVIQKNSDKLNNLEYSQYKQKIEEIKNKANNSNLNYLLENLEDKLDKVPEEDKSKVSLEISKVYNYLDNSSQSNNNFIDAVFSSELSTDETYKNAGINLKNIINGESNDNSQEYTKNNVANFLDNSSIYNKEKISNQTDKDGVCLVDSYLNKVSQIASYLYIGTIDAENFKHIEANITIDANIKTNDLKNELVVSDNGYNISNFDIEKNSYDNLNIILLCDVSASMSSNMDDLKKAVISFIESKNKNENLQIVTFSSAIVNQTGFSTTNQQLLDFANSMQVDYDTNIFDSIHTVINYFPIAEKDNNILILLTDGQDNDKKSEGEIESVIGNAAADRKVSIYTLGLGDGVDSEYLDIIAKTGNGKYSLISNSDSIQEFYNLIHWQLYNQYKLSYDATEVEQKGERALKVSFKNNSLSDRKNYYLKSEQDKNTSPLNKTIDITSLSPRAIYKSKSSYNVLIKGEGFTENDKVSITLSGDVEYSLSDIEYVDSQTFKFTLPSNISLGNYIAKITINDETEILQNALSVYSDNETSVIFGPYTFTCSSLIENYNNNYTLKSPVVLNGWLHFRGDITIDGKMESNTFTGSSIKVIDNNGSYIEYESSNSKGLAKTLFADKNIPVIIGSFGSFNLYNDLQNLYNYDNYLVDKIELIKIDMYNFVRFDRPSVSIYPSFLSFTFNSGSDFLPFQEKIFDGKDKINIEGSVDSKCRLTNQTIGLIGEFKTKLKKSVSLFNNFFQISSNSIDIKVDTIKDEYKLGLNVGFNFLNIPNDSKKSLGFELELKSIDLESIYVYGTGSLETNICGVPISITKLGLKGSNLKETLEDDFDFRKINLEGTISLELTRISDAFPGLKKFSSIEKCLLSLPNTKISFNIGDKNFEVKTNLMLLETVTVAEANLKIGQFKFSNSLLGYRDQEVNGLLFKLRAGLPNLSMLDDRIKLDIAAGAEIDIHNKLVGLIIDGNYKVDIEWWFISYQENNQGNLVLGLMKTHQGDLEFVFAYDCLDSSGNRSKKFYYIDSNFNFSNRNGELA